MALLLGPICSATSKTWQVVDLLKHVNDKSVPAEVIQQQKTLPL